MKNQMIVSGILLGVSAFGGGCQESSTASRPEATKPAAPAKAAPPTPATATTAAPAPARPAAVPLPGVIVAQTTAVAGEPAPTSAAQPGSSANPATSPAATPVATKPESNIPTDKAASDATALVWPAAPAKQLYAGVDVRGKAAPKFEVEEWIGTAPKTEGKVVLVDFWATWCAPCRALIPELEEWQKQFKDDLVVVGVSDEPMEKVLGFITNRKVGYPMAIDTRASTMKKTLAVQGIPHVLVIDSKGIVRWQGFPQLPADRLSTQTLEQIIKADRLQRGK